MNQRRLGREILAEIQHYRLLQSITSLFFTKYSMPEYTVEARMTTVHTRSSAGREKASIRQIHTMVEAVFTLPDQAAAMTRAPLRGDQAQGGDGKFPDDDDQKRPGAQTAHLNKAQQRRP